MSDLSYDIQALLGAPTALDYQNANNVATQNNAVVNQQQLAAKQAQTVAALGAASLQKYLNAPLDDPNRLRYYNAAITLNPQLKDGIQQGYKDLNDQQKLQHLTDASAQLGYAQNNDWDGAINHLQSIIDADQKAGNDTSEDQHMLQLYQQAKAGDKQAAAQALNMSQLYVSSLVGPDKFAEAYPDLVKLPTDIAKTQADINSTNAEVPLKQAQAQQAIAAANEANASANQKQAGQLAVNTVTGELYNNNPNAQQPSGTFDQSQSDQSIAQGYAAMQPTEYNTNGPSNIKNPNSSALGPSQAVAGTWLSEVKQNFPELAKGKTDAQILALRTDPNVANQVGQSIYKQGAYALQSAELPVNNTTAALAYKLGAGGGADKTKGAGAINVLKAAQVDPNKSLADVLPANVIAANPNMRSNGKPLSVGEYVNSVANDIAKHGNAPDTALALGNPNATGEEFLNTLPKGQADLVRQIGTYKLKPPVGQGGTTEIRSPIMKAVLQAFPNFNTNGYKVLSDLGDSTTQSGKQVNAFNTYIQHLAEFAELARQRNANAGVIGNTVGNVAGFLLNNKGKTNQINAKLTNLSKIMAAEKAALYGTDSKEDREQYRNDFNLSDDTATINSTIDQNINAALDKINSLKKSTEQQLGSPVDMSYFVNPDTQHTLKKIQATIQTREPNHNDIQTLLSNPTPQNIAYYDKTFGAGAAHRLLSTVAHNSGGR